MRQAYNARPMPTHRVRTRPAAAGGTDVAVSDRPEAVAAVLEDAAHYPGGHATGVAYPRTEAEVASLVRGAGWVMPIGAQRRVGTAQRTVHPGIQKTAADMIVPFERFARSLDLFRTGFECRGLDYAIWGHVSDGNVHPNVIPEHSKT